MLILFLSLLVTAQRRYKLIPEKSSWQEALINCKRRFGGDLASITSYEDIKKVKKLLGKEKTKYLWIGEAGKWTWSVKNGKYIWWHKSGKEVSKCGVYSREKFTHGNCELKLPYICMKDDIRKAIVEEEEH